MPVVIDLVSSPERRPARVSKTTDIPVPPKSSVHSKTPIYDAPRLKNDDWLTLSSDDDVALPLPIPAAKPHSSTIISKPSSGANTSENPKPSMSAISKSPRSMNISKPSNDFFFLSDDFDSTVNLSDPFASDPPPAKKRRLSPPPNSSLITRSPQYQRWISGLEKGTSAGSSKDAVPNLPSNQRSASDLGTSNKPAYPKLNAGSSKDGASSLPSYKRSISDIGASTKSTAPNTNALKRSKTRSTIIESDPIIFTSSPDPVVDARKRKEKQKRDRINQMLAISSDEVESDLHVPKKNQGKTKSAGKEPLRSGHGHVLRNFEISQSSDLDLPDLGAIPSQSDFKKSGRGKEKGKSAVMTALDRYEAEKAKERKQKEKEQKAKERLAAKETEKEQKRLAKEEKAREKDRAADLAKVNTLRTDKKVSTPEMIVDLPSCLNTLNPLLKEKIENFLKPVEAEYSEWQCKQPIIKWRRKIDAKFNEEAGHWEKVPSYIGTEKHVMCIMTAKEFVDLATGEEGKDLDSHVLGLKAKFDTNEIIYLIEGLEAWMRKNKNLQNRKFVQGVRSQMPEDAPAPSANQKRKKKKPELEYVDEDLIEDALLKLQVVHGALIHHTKVMIDTAEWVIIFTQHISTIPYRVQKESLDTAFCMESGQVKAGDGPADTFVKMLQEMVRVTAPIAYGIAAEYPTVQKLVKGFREKGNLALAECRKSANKGGMFTDKRIGPSVSKRVYNVFMCRDAGSWDV